MELFQLLFTLIDFLEFFPQGVKKQGLDELEDIFSLV